MCNILVFIYFNFNLYMNIYIYIPLCNIASLLLLRNLPGSFSMFLIFFFSSDENFNNVFSTLTNSNGSFVFYTRYQRIIVGLLTDVSINLAVHHFGP